MTENEAIVFPRANEVALESKPVPNPGPGEVLIETCTTLISTGTELMNLTGSRPDGSNPFPFEPGYNNIGRVVSLGEGVEDLEVGQRVASFGGHQRLFARSADTCHPVPASLADETAVFFTIAEIVMNGIRRGEVSFGNSVGVYGLGLLGQFAVRLAHLAGAQPVFGLDIAADRLDYLPESAGIIGLDPSEDGWLDAIDAETDGRLVDTVFEVTGNPSAIPDEFDILRDLGRFVVLGSPRGETTFEFNRRCHNPGYTIVGAHSRTHPETATRRNPWTKERHIELFFELLANGRLGTRDLISHQVSYREAPAIYEMLLEDRSQALGVAFEWPASDS